MNKRGIIVILVSMYSGVNPESQRYRCHIIKIKSLKFTPKEFFIDYNDTVRWINESNVSHRIVAKDGSFKSPLLKKGETFKYVFKRTGYFNYTCTLHKLAGEKGVVKVIID